MIILSRKPAPYCPPERAKPCLSSRTARSDGGPRLADVQHRSTPDPPLSVVGMTGRPVLGKTITCHPGLLHRRGICHHCKIRSLVASSGRQEPVIPRQVHRRGPDSSACSTKILSLVLGSDPLVVMRSTSSGRSTHSAMTCGSNPVQHPDGSLSLGSSLPMRMPSPLPIPCLSPSLSPISSF